MKHIETNSYEDGLRAELARKLTLLMEVSAKDRGAAFTYNDIAAELKKRGISLSRPRWSYMLNGTGPLVTDPLLLKELAEVFRVPPSYLVPGADGPLPERIEAELNAIRAIKHSKVQLIAARELGEVSPKTLAAIIELLSLDVDDGNEDDD